MSEDRSEPRGRVVVYGDYVRRLIAVAKPLRDQIIIEAAVLQALRTGEISRLRVEWLDFERGDMQLLDSKKDSMFTLPMDLRFAKHCDEYIHVNGRREGVLIQPLPGAPHVGRKPGSKTHGYPDGLTIEHIDRVFATHSCRAGIPIQSPRLCRAYFACYEHFVLRKPIGYIQFMLRHDTLQATEHYMSERIVFYEDQRTIFYQGKEVPYFVSKCNRSDKCPNAAAGCYCAWFQPLVETVLAPEQKC